LRTQKQIFPILIVAFELLLLPSLLIAQQSGRVYEFLGLPFSARITALGGYAVPTGDADLETALVFPSLLRPEVSNMLSLNFADYFSDINFGTLAYARSFERLGTFSASMHFIDYGTFTETDEVGQIFGNFTASEYSMMIGWGRPLSEYISIGSNIKLIYSQLFEYYSAGVAVDVSLTYYNPNTRFAAGLVARNAGRQLIHFRENNREALPFDLVLGISQRLARAPLRFSVVAHNLHNFGLNYDAPGETNNQNILAAPSELTPGQRVSEFADKVLRHIVIGAEFLPSPNFSLHFGYNYRRRQELQVESRISTVGFSWGFGVRISRFRFSYGRATYHLAGAPNHITISTRMDELFGTRSPATRNLRHDEN